MARHKKGNPIHGWLVLDKPIGMTSTQAVATIKHLYDAQKAGHAGTLDPLATGILPIALGEATKTCSFAVEGEKAYRFTVRWGIETNTDDAEGEVVRTSDKRPIPEEIEAILPDFTGEIEQVPPTFSAIKVNGERAYDWPATARCRSWSRVPCSFPSCGLLSIRTGIRLFSKQFAVGAPTFARWPVIWGAPSVATAMSRLCAGLRLGLSTRSRPYLSLSWRKRASSMGQWIF